MSSLNRDGHAEFPMIGKQNAPAIGVQTAVPPSRVRRIWQLIASGCTSSTWQPEASYLARGARPAGKIFTLVLEH